MSEQWRFALMVREDYGLTLDRDIEVPYWVIKIDDCMQEVLKTRTELFSLKYTEVKRLPKLIVSTLGRTLLQCLKVNRSLVRETYPNHHFSVYYELFEKKVKELDMCPLDLLPSTVPTLNKLVEDLRNSAMSKKFKEMLAAQRRAVSENKKSVLDYLTDLFYYNARLLVVRVDLKFTPQFRASLQGRAINPEYVRRCFNKFQEHFDREFPHLVGFIRKLEYGAVTQYHFHVILFFNGNKVREDISIGDLVGERWIKVTEEMGDFGTAIAVRKNSRTLARLGSG